MQNNKFIHICAMEQSELKQYVAKELKATHDKITEADGFIFAKGKFPVLLVAHLDTVHKQVPYEVFYDECLGSYSSPQGIGGDDRCGVYMILEVIKKFNCSVLFCEDEEIGLIGAHKFTKHDISKSLEFNYIIEFDRMGKNDAVFYDCENPEFEDFILENGFYKFAYGLCSDISDVAPHLGCAAVNLSCGYYNPHTINEYVIVSQMQKSIDAACEIIARTTEKDKFEYIEAKYTGNSDWYKKYCDDSGTKSSLSEEQYIIEYNSDYDFDWYTTWATSAEEAVGIFCLEHPDIPASRIIDYYRI